MSVEAALGTLSVRSKSAGLELMLSSSIKYTASEGDEAEGLQTRLTALQLNNNSLSTPFLYCDSSLLLTISLHILTALTAKQHIEVIEKFSTQLFTAMLWQQLRFSPPSIRTSSTENDRTVIEMNLTQRAEVSDDSQRMQHKLGTDVPFNDVRPPPGIPTATLDSVLLDMTIQHGPRSQNESAKTPSMIHTAYSASDEHTSQVPDGGELISFLRNEFQDGLQLNSGVCEADIANELPFSVDPDDEEVDSLDSEMLLEADDSSSQITDHLLNILDAAIRRAISLSSGPVTKGVSVESDKAFISLSSIAPALFRQHYLPAVASRAIFVPTISKSISAICSRQANSQPKERIASSIRHLSTFSLRDNGANGFAQQDTGSSTHERIKHLPQLLWMTLDRGSLGSRPERRLKPLSMGFGDSQSCNLDGELLGVLDALETCHVDLDKVDSNDCFLHESFEEDCYSDYEDMLDDIGAFSDCGSEFGSDDSGGYDSTEELEWDYDYLFDTCHQHTNYVSRSAGNSDMPIVTTRSLVSNTAADLCFEAVSEATYGNFGVMSWIGERSPARCIGSPKSLAISEDDMLAI